MSHITQKYYLDVIHRHKIIEYKSVAYNWFVSHERGKGLESATIGC